MVIEAANVIEVNINMEDRLSPEDEWTSRGENNGRF